MNTDDNSNRGMSGDAGGEQLRWLDDPPRFRRFIKRMIDVIGSIAAIVLLGPILILIAVVIKLTSKGPILLGEERRGYHGRIFTSYKFRSMYTGQPRKQEEYVAELIHGRYGEMGQAGVYKITNDPRITRVGSFLRRTSLDELPQLFNVLLGDMSLVGPRPPLSYEWGEYYDDQYKMRLSCRPGITGLWQVSGRHALSFDEMVKLDLQYASRQSLLLDLRILLRTPFVVLSGRGAY
jgi:lipopolysaccharide/colanic/teichoic acid biosynthesis glycosyltransferase